MQDDGFTTGVTVQRPVYKLWRSPWRNNVFPFVTTSPYTWSGPDKAITHRFLTALQRGWRRPYKYLATRVTGNG